MWTGKRAAAGTPMDDGILVSRLRGGEPGAFEELVRSEGGRMLAVARNLLRNEDDARDAVQTAFLSAFRGLTGFTGDCRVSTWLHRIVVNAALMMLRSRRRRPEESIEALLPTFDATSHHVDAPVPWKRNQQSEFERGECRTLVRRCIDRLPDSYRTVLMLRDIEELDTAETACLLGCSENAVKVRLHRARQALRTLLDPYLRQPATR